MMRFPARMDGAGATQARRDLERLLRAAASWDQPGRAKEPTMNAREALYVLAPMLARHGPWAW